MRPCRQAPKYQQECALVDLAYHLVLADSAPIYLAPGVAAGNICFVGVRCVGNMEDWHTIVEAADP